MVHFALGVGGAIAFAAPRALDAASAYVPVGKGLVVFAFAFAVFLASLAPEFHVVKVRDVSASPPMAQRDWVDASPSAAIYTKQEYV